MTVEELTLNLRSLFLTSLSLSPLSQMTGMERGRLLIDAARALRSHVESVARLDVTDNGKPIWEARADMETVIACLEYYGGLAPAWNGEI